MAQPSHNNCTQQWWHDITWTTDIKRKARHRNCLASRFDMISHEQLTSNGKHFIVTFLLLALTFVDSMMHMYKHNVYIHVMIYIRESLTYGVCALALQCKRTSNRVKTSWYICITHICRIYSIQKMMGCCGMKPCPSTYMIVYINILCNSNIYNTIFVWYITIVCVQLHHPCIIP